MMGIDELKAAMRTVSEIEQAQLLAAYRTCEDEIVVGMCDQHPRIGTASLNFVITLRPAEIIDTVVVILERRLALMRASLRDAGIDPEAEG